ncbi:hypothetical protein WICPIJ_007807 [Wickerhamomyces pijperi]|uniref:Uncharacterized protein n=1 Tax=Wickerhamomyces pijperi TaxID=599730 RepID=A0A9P8Q1W1_WICPI|nr:hypothetical protein WICPIJ_007807 [Wickerhamomyces pijperi]
MHLIVLELFFFLVEHFFEQVDELDKLSWRLLVLRNEVNSDTEINDDITIGGDPRVSLVVHVLKLEGLRLAVIGIINRTALQQLRGDLNSALDRPFTHPVNDTTIEQGRGRDNTAIVLITGRITDCKDNVQVSSHFSSEPIVQFLFGFK